MFAKFSAVPLCNFQLPEPGIFVLGSSVSSLYSLSPGEYFPLSGEESFLIEVQFFCFLTCVVLVNFSYDGEKLSDYGCIVASLRTTYQDSVQIGANIAFDTIQNQATHMHKIINSKYDDVIAVTFDICRNPCLYNNDMEFSDGEISHFMRWLNQKE